MCHSSRQRGFSLFELVVVVTIIGMAAALAIPGFSSSLNEHQLSLAASEAADALRFARTETLRTGSVHGADIEVSENRVRVFRLDSGPVYDVYHPVTKQLYELDTDTHSLLSGVSLSTFNHTYKSSCSNPSQIAFQINGAPVCAADLSVVMEQGVLTLSDGSTTQDVTLHGYIGRVVEQ